MNFYEFLKLDGIAEKQKRRMAGLGRLLLLPLAQQQGKERGVELAKANWATGASGLALLLG